MIKVYKNFIRNNKNISYFIYILCIALCPSCIKYYKVLKKEVPQGSSNNDHRDLTYRYLRTGKIYDEFRTLGIFHSLLVSKEVQERFSYDYCNRRGITGIKEKSFKESVLKENENIIKFLVITDLRQKQINTKINDENAYWTMYLKISKEKKIEPKSIKEIDLKPEYQAMFGHRYNPFNTTYLITFDSKDIDINDSEQDLSLVITSPEKSTTIEWKKENIKNQVELLKDEDFYWG